MQNNNKYRQETRILNKTVFYDNDGNTKYTYIVFVNMWNKEKKRYEPTPIYIRTINDYDFSDKITVKMNKSLKGEIYFTEVDPLDLLPISEAKIEDNDELPFNV